MQQTVGHFVNRTIASSRGHDANASFSRLPGQFLSMSRKTSRTKIGPRTKSCSQLS
jgi:hypothetical protein